jgi:transcriptional antiterminator NusG
VAYLAINVRARSEERFVTLAQPVVGPENRLLFLRRRLRIKRAGAWHGVVAPIFPGYLFLRVDEEDPDLIHVLRSLPGFIRFLPANNRIMPLDARDEALVRHFLSFGEVLEKSLVEFDENRRIRVVSGPLKGLDGRIVKVDRRKQRARVKLELYQETFEIDFGFEALEPAPQPAPVHSQG